MKELILVRGLPGSGKSTLATKLMNASTRSAVHAEADDYWALAGPFDPSRLGEAYTFCESLAEGAMQTDVETVIVANTFVLRSHMTPYYKMAEAYGYKVTEIAVTGPQTNAELSARNVHGVPVETIERMRRLWQT